ncbi:MAG: tetratricopeptide repeat protein [Pseudohongiellaceae bacterium]
MIQLDFSFADDNDMDSIILGQSADAFPEIETMALNQEIIDYLEANVRSTSSDREVVDRLRELLFEEDYLNIQYDDLKTRTAIETFQDRQGNCLSVVSLYIAMARHFGVDARFQTVKVRPRWDRRGELLVISQHINAVGRFGQSTYYVVDFTPEISVQQLTASTVTDTHARALYFNNLGVERLIAGEYEKSLQFFKNALWIDPALSIAWNNIGTAYNRNGDKTLAEYAYRKAYATDKTNATAINNLAKYYHNQGDLETSERYARAIERFNNSNPYYHYNMGNMAYAEADFEMARQHFTRAIRRKEAEPDFYYALSKTYEQLGDELQSQRMYQMARLMVLASDEIYLPSQDKVRIVNEKSILRETSAGFSINTGEAR